MQWYFMKSIVILKFEPFDFDICMNNIDDNTIKFLL